MIAEGRLQALLQDSDGPRVLQHFLEVAASTIPSVLDLLELVMALPGLQLRTMTSGGGPPLNHPKRKAVD